MIRTSTLTSLLLLFATVVSAYNRMQGILAFTVPCFHVYDHKKCNRSLSDVYTIKSHAPASNKPTTKMFLFTGSSKQKAEQIHQCAGRLPPGTTFNASCPTEVFLHGFSDGICRTAWMREMKEQLFLKSDCYNIIFVDWTWGNFPDFPAAVLNAKGVSEQVAYVLKNIARQKKYDCKKYHLVANSLGVTIASYVGKYMQGRSCRLGRITALDNAFPPFLDAPLEDRLNPNDALFVDVIHTNRGKCFSSSMGDHRLSGHVDMYVGDGVYQPSCIPYALVSLLKLDLMYAIASWFLPGVCSHIQSIQFYKASINAGKDNSYMIGALCDNYEEFESGKCPRTCEKEGTCAPLGLDLPLFYNTTGKKRSVFQVPSNLFCPYNDHSGFSGLPLTRIKSGLPV